MKKISLLSLLFFFYFSSFSQDRKSSLSIAFGPSFPIGDFADRNSSNEKAGLAKTGAFVDLGYQYAMTKNFGLAAALKGSIYGVDMSSYQMPTGVGASMQVETTTWKTGAILAGVYQEFPISPNGKLSLGFRELIGVQFTRSPEVKINITVPGMGVLNGDQQPANATSFAYALAGGLKYQFNPGLGLKLFADYSGTLAKFEVTGSAGGTAIQPQETDQRIDAVGLGVGLVIGF